MKKTLSGLFAATLLAAAGTGCISTVDGGKSAGVPFRKDRIVSRYQLPVEQVFVAAKEVLGAEKGGLGVLQSENRINNSLIAKVNSRMVYVKVSEVEPNIVEIVTQVRTDAGWSDLDWASEIDKQVALRLQYQQSAPATAPATK